MCESDSFFDRIELVPTVHQTFRKPSSICKSLEKIFATCNNAPTVKKQTHLKLVDDPLKKPKHKSIPKTESFHMKPDNYITKQLHKQSKSYLFLKQNQLNNTSNNSSIYQNQNKSYICPYRQLNIDIENEQFISNMRQKTISNHQNNSYRMSLVSLLRQQTKSKNREHSLANICKTLQDETRNRVSSTHRGITLQLHQQQYLQKQYTHNQPTSKMTQERQRQDSCNAEQNIRKSNSVYLQEFRKVFSKQKFNHQ